MISTSCSKVLMCKPLWKRLILFQSIRQLNSYLLCLLLVICTFIPAYGWLNDWSVSDPSLLFIFSAPAITSLLPVLGVLQAKFIITSKDNTILERIENNLLKLGYTSANNQPGYFVHLYPSWFKWNENSFEIKQTSHNGQIVINITGPYATLKMLRTEMKKEMYLKY